MRVVNWNLRRPTRSTTRNTHLKQHIAALAPDILILTETNAVINPGPGYDGASSWQLSPGFDGIAYAAGENRTSIFSRYPITAVQETGDPFTNVCAELTTPFGPLLIYATIIGVFGGNGGRFARDFALLQHDVRKLAPRGALCVAGDFNLSFAGYPYPSKRKIQDARRFFELERLRIVTGSLPDIPDHIAFSWSYLSGLSVRASALQVEKTLSDHHIVCAEILPA